MMVKTLARVFRAAFNAGLMSRLSEYRGGHLWDGDEIYMGRFGAVDRGTAASKALLLLTGGRYDSCRLHWIRKADADRELHDHPFNYRTFVLEGWYDEEYIKPEHMNASMLRTWQGSRSRLHPDTVRSMTTSRFIRSGTSVAAEEGQFHRIADVNDGGVWTLFFMGKDTGKWGFLVDGRWLKSSKFFQMRGIDHNGRAA